MSKREMPEAEPLNLVPIMNLVTILIPVLLVAIKSLELAVIDTTLPAISSAPPEVDELPDKPPLSLKVGVTNLGVSIIGADPYLYPAGRPPVPEGSKPPPTIPCKSNGRCTGINDYNWLDLAMKLTDIKDKAVADERDSNNVVLLLDSNIKYEILVMVMDVTRNRSKINKPGAKPPVVLIDEVKVPDPDPACATAAKKCTDIPKELFPNVVIAGGTN